jgi:hypothetical protein
MLAIAGITAWLGYLVMTYGLSQVGGQNYSIGQLAIPGRFTLGNPAPDPPVVDPCAGKKNPTDGSYAWVVQGGKCVKQPRVPGGTTTMYKGQKINIGQCGDGSTPNAKTGKCKDGTLPYGISVGRGGR